MAAITANCHPRQPGRRRPAAPMTDSTRRPTDPLVILLMGVSGSGKSTVGQALAHALDWSFRDADDFHPVENVTKMSAGIPLDDKDRRPWLAAIRAHIEATLARGQCGVVTCSALTQRYRRLITGGRKDVKLVHLVGDFDLIYSRMITRRDHFMKPEMLRSQFALLEPPADALTIEVGHPPDAIVAEIRRNLGI
jgi:gluconokinase